MDQKMITFLQNLRHDFSQKKTVDTSHLYLVLATIWLKNYRGILRKS